MGFKLIPIVGLMIISVYGCTSDSAPQSEMEVEFQETLQIGADDQAAPDKELFQMVTNLEEDAYGNIYLVDSREIAVRVYNEEGEFQYKFGSKGSGPGEMESISDLLIDSQNRLLIVDSNQAQVSAFTLEGDHIQSWELPSLTRVHQIEELSDGRFVLVGHSEDQLVHIVDDDFSGKEYSFVNIDDVITTDDEKERVMVQFYPGYITVKDDRIIFAPNHYQGELNVYSESEAGDEWSLRSTIEGYARHSTSVSISSFEQADRVDVPIGFPDEGRYAGQYHVSSQGIYPIEGDSFVHFSLQERNGYLEMLSEFFTAEEKLASTAVVDTMSTITVSVLNMKKGEDIYLSDRKKFPKLRRLTMSKN